MNRRTITLCVAATLVSSVVAALPAGADNHLETVLTGVDNGRGVAFDAAGNLYVASSGTGGAGPCISAPEGEGATCYGDSGTIHRLAVANLGGPAEDADAAGQVFVDSLPSLAPQEGEFAMGDAIGPADVSVGADGRVYFTIGLGANPSVRDGDLESASNEDAMASLHSVNAAGADLTEEADLGDLEATDPDGAGADTNPFGVVADTANDVATVADSGGNTVVSVPLAGGDPSVLTVLQPTLVPAPPFLGAPAGTNIPAQAVPTQHTALSGGGYALGQLTGFPFPVGGSKVFNVTGSGAMPWYHGFTNIMDVAEDDGAIYVLELTSDGLLAASGENPPMGSLIRVTQSGGTVTRELLVDDLLMPGGMAIRGDFAYITLGSGLPAGAPLDGAGEVVRFNIATAEPLLSVVDDVTTTEEDLRLVAGDADGQDDRFVKVVADVAANDTGVTEIQATDLSKGAATVVDGELVYQPLAHASGPDEVVYRGCDAEGTCLNGTLMVDVDGTETDRIAGENRVLTAIEASMAHFPDGAPAVLLARADLYPDALAGGPLAAAVNGPILLSSGDALDAATAAEIRRLGATKAYVLGGPVALAEAVEDAVTAIVADTERIGGANRNATAVEIKDEIEEVRGQAAVMAFIVEGRDPDPNRGWPDAVAISGLASNTLTPILLVETDSLPSETATAIADLGTVTVVGGPVAISDATQAAIDDATGEVNEIAGDTRYHTSQLIAQSFANRFGGVANLAVVSGGNWPDALVAGPLTGPRVDGLILVHPTDLSQSPETVAFMQDNGPFADLDLWGGPVAISTEVEAGLAALNE